MISFKKILFFMSVLFFLTQCKTNTIQLVNPKQNSSIKWSERMANSIMAHHPHPFQIDDKEKPKWDYVHGLVMTGFEQLYKKSNNETYFNYLKLYSDTLIDEKGNIATYKLESYNIDMVVAGNHLFYLYEVTKNSKYKIALDKLRSQLNTHPRTSEGGFWHKKIYPNQMWLDGLYMGAPFYAQYNVRYENASKLNDIALQFELIQKHLYDSKTGLLFHGWDESKQMAWANPQTGCSPNFWSRSLGWYAMALVDVLDFFPENHTKRQELITYFSELCNNLLRFQHASGMWHQVTDQGERDGNYLETSATAMFSYAFAKGANKGYLNNIFKSHAHKAFDGIINNQVKMSPEGHVILTNCCAVAGLGGTPFRDGSFEYYINEKKKDNDPKATGPFILAALELNR
ncbi:MAG: glycoside hydrolase family 105 protein [Flavobacterium sp.]